MKYKKPNFEEMETRLINDNIEDDSEFKFEVNDFDLDAFNFIEIDDIDEKTLNYIKNFIRSSYEYRSYINYLKDELAIIKDGFLNININETPVSLEFHHYPLTLHNIVETMLKYMLSMNNNVDIFSLAEEVMKEHYLGNIGLIPLTKTNHELAHSGKLIIPLNKVLGNYRNFINKYEDCVNPEILKHVNELEQITDETAKLNNKEFLEINKARYTINYNHD